MTLVLNGTTGVSAVDGSAATPAIQGNDTNTGVFFPAADTVAVATGGSERMRVDSSGNVGIGTTSPAYRLQIAAAPATSANFVGQFIARTSGADANVGDYAQFGGSGDSGYFGRRYNATIGWMSAIGGTNAVAFHTGNIGSETERARIDSSGNLLVGSTTTGYTDSRLVLSLDNSTKWVTGPGAGIATRFYVSASNAGGVYLNGTSATSWTAISDERYKTDLTPIADGLAKVCSLRAVTGRLTTDEIGTSKAFLIAQDVLAVLPEAVDTTDPDRYGLAYTDTIPLMVAAIQEQQALIAALQADVAALKGQA